MLISAFYCFDLQLFCFDFCLVRNKHTHIVCGVIHIIFSQYSWKLFQSNFEDFSRPGYHSSWQSWKSGPEDSILHPKRTDTLWGAILLISRQYGQKIFRSSFDNFSGSGTTGAKKVENRPQMTWFSARNIPTLFGVQFLSFPISTAKQCFGPILTTFLGPSIIKKIFLTVPHVFTLKDDALYLCSLSIFGLFYSNKISERSWFFFPALTISS